MPLARLICTMGAVSNCACPLTRGRQPWSKFIHRLNLEHYRQQLGETKDETQRKMLLKLLAEEEAKEPSVRRPAETPPSVST